MGLGGGGLPRLWGSCLPRALESGSVLSFNFKQVGLSGASGQGRLARAGPLDARVVSNQAPVQVIQKTLENTVCLWETNHFQYF